MELDEALDELYGLPPDEFVARRDELARRLREAGARDAADELVSRRRPTVAAWAVNQLPRRRADDLERLLEVADRVRDAQRRALSGRAGDLRTAMVDLRTVVNELTDAAVMLVEERGSSSGAHRDHVAATLHAAAVDDEVREAVARGRLTRAAASSGFGALAGMSALADRGEAPPDRGEASPDPGKATADAATAGRRSEQQTRVRDLRGHLRDLDLASDRQERRVREAEERAARLRGRATEAEDQAADERRRRERLLSERDRVRAELEHVERELDEAL